MTHQPWFGFAAAELVAQNAHDGVGLVHAARVVDRPDGPLAFVDLVVVPAGASVGRHTHGDDEELYVVVSGRAEMIVDGEQRTVGPGDVVHNRAGGTHALHNAGPEELRMVVVDVRNGTSPAPVAG